MIFFGCFNSRILAMQRLKPTLNFVAFSAWLKPSPDTTRGPRRILPRTVAGAMPAPGRPAQAGRTQCGRKQLPGIKNHIHLAAVQKRREFPMRFIQGMQVLIQNRIITRVLASPQSPKPPLAAKLLDWFPPLRRIPARILGVGVQREHVQTPDAAA